MYIHINRCVCISICIYRERDKDIDIETCMLKRNNLNEITSAVLKRTT